jgi:predicted AAA+ superfamily ATPase
MQKVANIRLLTDATRHLMHNVGNLASLRRIADTLGPPGRKPSPATVDSYPRGPADAFLLHRVPRWDVKGRRFLEGRRSTTRWTGCATRWRATRPRAPVTCWRNLVFLQLRRQYSQVRTGASPGGEIDFVVPWTGCAARWADAKGCLSPAWTASHGQPLTFVHK